MNFLQWLRFFSRVAFLGNLAFGLCVALQWSLFITNQAILSTLLVLGFFLAPFVFSPVITLLYLVAWLRKQTLAPFIPNWLVAVNVSFFFLQILFVLFFLHDSFFP